MQDNLLKLPMQFFAEGEENPVDDGQGLNVEGQIPAADDGATPEGTPTPTEGQGTPPAQEPAKPVQTAEENAAFATVRWEAEALARRQIDEEYKRMYTGQPNPYTGRPIESKADFLEYERQHALHQMAEKTGVSVQEQEALLKKTLHSMPEYQRAIAQAREAQAQNNKLVSEIVKRKMDEDLAAIKKVNPKEAAKSVDDLGTTFIRLIGAGVDTLTAYDLVLKERQRQVPPPPSMGDIGAGDSKEAELYTVEQMQAMSPEDMRRNWEKVQKSRKHIFK